MLSKLLTNYEETASVILFCIGFSTMLLNKNLLKKIIGTTMVMAATYMLQMFDLIYITTNGGPGKTTTNLPLLLYSVFKSENNYGYANTIGVMIIVLGAVVMVVINKALKVNEEDY